MGEENAEIARWFKIQEKIEAIMLKEKNIKPNVDFYSATVLHTLQIDEDLFTPLFAIARTTGWTAHIIEQLSDNRLIRPLANYVGAMNLPVPKIKDR
jgi:citrate synthase